MNYWLLTTEYPPFFGGGISTYCYHTSCMLSQQGHKVTVFVNDRSVNSFVIEQLQEARIIRFNPSRTTSDLFLGEIAHLSFEFAEIVKCFVEKEGKPDMIECQDYNGIGYFLLQFRACLYEWCSNIPIVLTLHSPSFLYLEYNQVPIYKRPNFWIGEMERFCMQAADLLISPSQYLINEIEKRFQINNANLSVVVNPYKYNSSGIVENQAAANNFTFYGKLSPQKGTFKVLEAFQLLWDKGFKESFTMIGGQDILFHPEGETMGDLVKKKYKLYISKGLLKLEKEIAPADRESFLSTSAIFIIPSIVDNLPYVVLELMNLGKIVIVSKQGGQSEVVSDGDDGFIFSYDEPGSFENALKKVLDLTKEQRLEIGKRAIEKINNKFGYNAVYTQKIKLLEALKSNYKNPTHFPFIRSRQIAVLLSDKPYTNGLLLSVVIPYYNLGAYIDETIQSILNSSYKQIEILIVNDGSTDPNSIKKIGAYKGHEKIKIIDKKNTGLSDTRNKGAEIANGDFLTFLDADDTVEPTYYEKAINILSRYRNVHFIGAWTQYFGKSKNTWPTFNPEAPLILTQNSINSSALVYKREAFIKGGLNDIDFKIGLEDYESVIHMKANGLNGVAIPEPLFNYRVRNNSMIKSVDKEVRATYFKQIKSKHLSFFSDFDEEVNNLLKFNGPPISEDNVTLDDLPFQQFPILRKIVRRLITIIKANPGLKRTALQLKKVLKKQ